MAIPHFRQQVISRGGGRCALAAAAYRHSVKMTDAYYGRAQCYGHKPEHVHSEFAVPPDAPRWVRDLPKGEHRRKDVKLAEGAKHSWVGREAAGMSEGFWNAVEFKEARKDAALCHEVVIALPVELTREQNIALIREFVADNYTGRGKVADWAYHDKEGNPHVHLMSPLRPLAEDGFGPKAVPRMGENGEVVRTRRGQVVYDKWAGGEEELVRLRHEWGVAQNVQLSMHGHEARVHMGQLRELGIETLSTYHRGVAANAMQDAIQRTDLGEDDAARRLRQFVVFERDPSLVVDHLAREHSTFGDAELSRLVFRYAPSFERGRALIERVERLDDLVTIQSPASDPMTGADVGHARYSTYHVIEREWVMADHVRALAVSTDHMIAETPAQAALTRVQDAQGFPYSPEQKAAIAHALSSNGLSVIAGYAGAGKSSVMTGVRVVNEGQGNAVVGGALAGKAAVSLTQSSGIAARTLASWEMAWERGRDALAPGTVFVLDEAGMVASDQMGRIVEKVRAFGAKLVLVGDARQLQPINAGAAFRSIANEVGYIELSGVRRQSVPWQAEASVRFARGDALPAMTDYWTGGHVGFETSREDARVKVLEGWFHDHRAAADTLMLAHTNADVHALNEGARSLIKREGGLAIDTAFPTERGERQFAPGDRVIFLRNDRRMDVQNGRLGEIERVEVEDEALFAARHAAWTAERARSGNDGLGDGNGDGDPEVDPYTGQKIGQEVDPDPEPTRRVTLHVRPDGADAAIAVASDAYRTIDHGYAATVHKSQGATIDRVHVLATNGFDAQLSYVAMTRHREDVRMTVALDTFAPRRKDDQGVLVPEEGAKVSPKKVSPKEALARMVEDRLKDTTLDYAGTPDHGFSLREIARLKEQFGGTLPTREELKAGPPEVRARVERMQLGSFLWRRAMPQLGEAREFLSARVALLGDRLNGATQRLTDARVRIENRLLAAPREAMRLGIEIRDGMVGELRSTVRLFSPFPDRTAFNNTAASGPKAGQRASFDFAVRPRSGHALGSERTPERGPAPSRFPAMGEDVRRGLERLVSAQRRYAQEIATGTDDPRSQMAHIHYMRRARFETREGVTADELTAFNRDLAAIIPAREVLAAGPDPTEAARWLATNRPDLDGNLKERVLTLWSLVHAGQKATVKVAAAMRFVHAPAPTAVPTPAPTPEPAAAPSPLPSPFPSPVPASPAPARPRTPLEMAQARSDTQPVLIPGRSGWTTTPAEDAAQLASRLEENASLRARIGEIAATVWRDPAPVLARIDALARDPGTLSKLAAEAGTRPNGLGALRGRALLGRSNGERVAALEVAGSRLRPVLERYAASLYRDMRVLAGAFERQRLALREPVRALSPEARALADELRSLGARPHGADLMSERIARGGVRADLAEEIGLLARAVDRRFPFTWKLREVRQLQIETKMVPFERVPDAVRLAADLPALRAKLGPLVAPDPMGNSPTAGPRNEIKVPLAPKMRM